MRAGGCHERRGCVGVLARWLLLLFAAGVLALGAAWVWLGPRIVGALVRETAAEAGVRLRPEAAGFGRDGVFLEIAEVRGGTWSVRDVRVAVPWAGLLPPDVPGAVYVRVGEVRVSAEEAAAPEAPAERPPMTPERLVALTEEALGALGEAFAAIPLRRVDFEVVRGRAEVRGAVVPFRLDGDLQGGPDSARRLAVRVDGPFVRMRLRCLGGAGAATRVGFRLRGERAGAFSRWVRAWVREVDGRTGSGSRRIGDLSVASFDGGGRWLELSGYARRSADGAVGAALLGRLAPWDVSRGNWTASFAGGGAGIVVGGEAAAGLRGHAELPLERARFGASFVRGGVARARYANGTASVSVEAGEGLLAAEVETADLFPAGREDRSVDFSWTLAELEGDWLRGLGTGFPPPGPAFTFSGEGSGSVDLKGAAVAGFRSEGHGAVTDAEWPGKEISGALPDIRFSVEGGVEGVRGGELRVEDGRLTAAGVTIDALGFLGRLEGGSAVRVERLRAGLLGGRVRVEPFAADLDPPEAEFRVRLENVALAAIAALVPRFRGEAEGRVSGFVRVVYREGVPRVADGRLELVENVPARLSYPAEGLLTAGMGKGTAAFQQYRRAEKALEDLALNGLRIDLFPGGEPTRPLRMTIAGESEQDGLRVPVEFTLNVNVENAEGLLEVLQKLREGELSVN